MGLKDLIKKWNDSRKEKSSEFKEMQERHHFEKVIEQRDKSSEERQLERFQEEDRQKRIKMALDKYNKNKTKELWKGDYSILNNQHNILKEDKQLLKQKNIFSGNQHKMNFTKQGVFLK
jgi:hypothetical protein